MTSNGQNLLEILIIDFEWPTMVSKVTVGNCGPDCKLAIKEKVHYMLVFYRSGSTSGVPLTFPLALRHGTHDYSRGTYSSYLRCD